MLSGCGTAINVANNTLSRSTLAASTGVSDADADDLRKGRIDQLLTRYQQSPRSALSLPQVSLLCDMLLKYRDFTAASACLDRYEAIGGGSVARSVAGKRALMALSLGDAAQAATLTDGLNDTGARYVHALAEARLGNIPESRRTAAAFERQFEPKQVYYAASLYSALGDNAAALRVLEDPQRRLLRDYGVTPNQTAFGAAALAPFHLDVFDEFTFGWFKDLSYAPAGNVYVEYLAAHSLLELNRLGEAKQRLDVLALHPGIQAYRDVWWLILYDQGRVAQRQGHGQEAEGYLRRSVDVIESVRSSVSSDEGRIGFVTDKQAVYALLVDMLTNAGETEAAFGYAERARGRALVDLLASRDDLVPQTMSREAAETSLNHLRLAEGEEGLASAGMLASSRGVDSSALRRSIAQRASSLAPLITVDPVSVAGIRRNMAPDETAVAFYAVGSNWIAFVVSQSELRTVRLPLTDTSSTVLTFLRSIVSRGSGGNAQAYLTGARALYDGLIRPVEPYIQGRRLVLAPYGILHYIPFAALNDGNSYLIDKYSFRQVPSLSAMTVANQNKSIGSGSLVIGNPSRSDAPALPSAQRESVEVGQLLPGSTVLVRDSATLNQFRALAPGKQYIHIASHGEFDAHKPLQSRLLLAPDPGDNGDLLVANLYSLRLNARLATLSACETAVSQVSDGDDLVGLVRGFLFAGTQNVVATLWEIDDVVTGNLMTNFYTSLAHGRSVPDSLREAQLETKKLHPEPIYWAAFMPTSFSPR